MATATVEEEVEYESDPEEVKRSLALRRRGASDDEEGEGVEDDAHDDLRLNQRTEIHADEYEDQGGIEEYDDYAEDLGTEDVVEELEGGYSEEEQDNDEDEGEDGREDLKGKIRGERVRIEDDRARNTGAEVIEGDTAHNVLEEEGKGSAPSAVPTAGAFFMHDDRFQDNVGGQHRRRGGKKLWDSIDDKKWGHDKFEQMSMQERQYDERQGGSKSRNRRRGGNGGHERRFARGRGSYNASHNNGILNQAPDVATRGRGPRKYDTTMKSSNQAPSLQKKRSGNPRERISHGYSRGASKPTANSEATAVETKKHTVASSLSYASPPFYPSGSSNNQTQELQVGMENLQVNEKTEATLKNLSCLETPSSRSLSVIAAPFSRPRGQGRDAPPPGQVICQQAPSTSQVNRVSATQMRVPQKGSPQPHAQPPSQAHDQQSEMSALVAKGKDSSQASGNGSFLYSGTPVLGAAGNVAVGHGDHNFPAFLPVVQFGGQHPGAGGLPAFGMAFPGYVAQPQHGVGNSEMTWLPVLTGAGALGASYHPPYAPLDGSYNDRASNQPTSLGSSSKAGNTNEINDESRPQGPQQRFEVTNNEIRERQNNPNKQPRRYSKMSFSK